MIDSRYLADLIFNDTKSVIPKEADKEGKRKMIYEKISRKLLPTDVLSFVEKENEVIFVSADGKKYSRPKLGKSGG